MAKVLMHYCADLSGTISLTVTYSGYLNTFTGSTANGITSQSYGTFSEMTLSDCSVLHSPPPPEPAGGAVSAEIQASSIVVREAGSLNGITYSGYPASNMNDGDPSTAWTMSFDKVRMVPALHPCPL